MSLNSIFNTYHSILKYLDKSGVTYTTDDNGSTIVREWMFQNYPVALAIKPFYEMEAVRILMVPGVDFEERVRPEIINLANILNCDLATCTLLITSDGELLVRDSLDAYSNAVEEEFVHNFLLRMLNYVYTFLEVSPLISGDGKTALEAHTIWVNTKPGDVPDAPNPPESPAAEGEAEE